MNNFGGIFLVLGLARESELVFGLAIGDFVDPVGLKKISHSFDQCEEGFV